MKNQCCVEDVNTSPQSSCSMILRSACLHKRTSNSSTVKEVRYRKSSSSRRNVSKDNKEVISPGADSCNCGTQIDSLLESSLKELALKSAKKTYSILKESLYSSFELSETKNCKVFERNVLNSLCAKEFNFNQLSSNNNSLLSNEHLLDCEEWSNYSSGVESDFSKNSIYAASEMSRNRRFNRSAVTSSRTLSESETEDETISFNGKSKNKVQDSNHYSMSKQMSSSELHKNSYNLSKNVSSAFGEQQFFQRSSCMLESPHIDVSSVQCSSFDWFRWLIWRCLYLKIIKLVNFDVWCLSRLHKYQKSRLLFLLLVPLLLLLTSLLLKYPTEFIQLIPKYPMEIIKDVICKQNNPSSQFEATSIFILKTKKAFELMKLENVMGMVLGESNSVLRLLNSGFSTLVVYLSSILSTLSSFFINSRELIVETSNEESTCFSSFSGIYAMFPSFSGLYTVFPSGKLFNIFSDDSKTEENPSHVSQHSFESSDAQHLLSKEELKILITDILKEEKISSIRSEIKKLRLEFQPLAEDLKKLEKDLIQRYEKIATSKTVESLITEHKLNYDYLHTKLKNVEKKLEVLDTVKKCCDEKLNPAEILSLIESYLIAALKNISDSNTKENFTYQFFTNWLNSNFVSQGKLSSEIKSEIEKLRGDYQEKMSSEIDVTKTIETVIHKYVESLKTNLTLLYDSQGSSHLYGEMFSMDVIKKLVKEAIMLYDADKTGLVDYALESGGGSVLGTRCSETYVEKNGKFSIFGLPLWTSYNSPRTAIQPDVNPGQCWAFKGSQGFLVLELSARIYPTGFTLEHIPVSLSPSGSIDSAPKDFSVWGLASETDSKGILLGKYTYDDKGEPLQYFAVQNSDAGSFLHSELKIHSNHGNIEYTCLYRFRVHGNRVK